MNKQHVNAAAPLVGKTLTTATATANMTNTNTTWTNTGTNTKAAMMNTANTAMMEATA
jgi:hypothetical protein